MRRQEGEVGMDDWINWKRLDLIGPGLPNDWIMTGWTWRRKEEDEEKQELDGPLMTTLA